MSLNFNLPIGFADSRQIRMRFVTWVRTIAVLLLLAALLFSVTELFDTWDNSPQTGNDIEYNAVLVILCVGATLACFRALWLTLMVLGRRLLEMQVLQALSPDHLSFALSTATPPPTTALRI